MRHPRASHCHDMEATVEIPCSMSHISWYTTLAWSEQREMLLKPLLASMMVLIVVVGSFAFPSFVLSQDKNKQSTTFVIEDERYQLTLPSGFCIPTGEWKKEADSQAQLDSSNITDVTAIRCSELSGTEGLSEWIILKTPKGSLGKRIPTRES